VSRFHLGDFRDRARDFARSNHSSRRLVLPISRPTAVIITPRKYPESPGSSRTAHGAAHGTSRRPAPTLCSWPIWTGKSVFRWLKSTLHYLPRLFPTPIFCKRAGLSPASPGAVLILVAGRARGGAFVPRCFARRRVPIGVSKKNALMEGQERALKPMIRRPCWYSDEP
jgi:hypothetical protein